MIRIMLSPAVIRITTMGWTIPGNVPTYYRGDLIYPLMEKGHRVRSSCGSPSAGYIKDWMTEQIKAIKGVQWR